MRLLICLTNMENKVVLQREIEVAQPPNVIVCASVAYELSAYDNNGEDPHYGEYDQVPITLEIQP
jgi:hypothetical protein